MTVNHHELYTVSSSEAAQRSGLRGFLRELAPHDWLVFGYLLLLNVVVLGSPPGVARTNCLASVFLLLACHATVTALVRTRTLTHPFFAPFLYRLAAWGGVQVTYFLFADLLPLVNHGSLDYELYQLDLTLFGVEPAMFMDRFVTPVTTEWFAFFYFGYFFVLGAHVLPILFLSRRLALLGQFALGTLLVFCLGHTLYMLVPGYGPYKAMPELFHNELPPGVWWSMTTELVAQSGAQKDIFPSLHTAAPTFILLFSFSNRQSHPFRFTWPIVAFFTANIIIATMFLRWHYVIDVLAGLLLAVTAHVISVRVTRRELARRSALGLAPLWPEWFARSGAASDARRPRTLPVMSRD